jgi:hypothetical protein
LWDVVGGAVVTHHAEDRRPRAQRRQVGGNVAGAPQVETLGLVHLHHRHRRFRRDAGHTAADKAVQHEISHHADAPALEAARKRAQASG